MTRKPKGLKPRAETKKKMRPMTRDAFTKIIDKAINAPATPPAPKST